MTKWEKLPAIERGPVKCTMCGCGAHETLSMERTIAVGFGSAGYSRDGEELWNENEIDVDDESTDDDYHTVGYVESVAKLQPDHDWRIYFFAPLYEAEYQRQGDGHWVLVRKGDGFA